MDRIGNNQIDNATNLSMGSNTKEGTPSTGANVGEAQSAFSGESHEVRSQNRCWTRLFQRRVMVYGSNQIEPILKNDLVPCAGEQPRVSASTTVSKLNSSAAERIDLLENINIAIEEKDWRMLNTLLNSEISSDLLESELINICENIYEQENLQKDCPKGVKADCIFVFAILKNQTALVKLLINIDFFAHFYKAVEFVSPPLDYARCHQCSAITQLLVAYLSPYVCTFNDDKLRHKFLLAASETGDIESAALLIAAEGNGGVRGVEVDGIFPLDVAVNKGKHEMMKLLLDVGKVDPEQGGLETPLQRGLLNRDKRSVELLLQWGAKVNFDTDTHDSSYLAYALESRSEQWGSANCLLQYGAKTDFS